VRRRACDVCAYARRTVARQRAATGTANGRRPEESFRQVVSVRCKALGDLSHSHRLTAVLNPSEVLQILMRQLQPFRIPVANGPEECLRKHCGGTHWPMNHRQIGHTKMLEEKCTSASVDEDKQVMIISPVDILKSR